MRTSVVVSLFVVLCGCATAIPTPYQRENAEGGYSEMQLDTNFFVISFQGNRYTTTQRSFELCLLRSAQVAMEKNFRYFVVVRSEKESLNRTYTTPSVSHTRGKIENQGLGDLRLDATTVTHGGQTYSVSRPRTTNVVLFFREKPGSEIFDDELGVRQARLALRKREAERESIMKELSLAKDAAKTAAKSFVDAKEGTRWAASATEALDANAQLQFELLQRLIDKTQEVLSLLMENPNASPQIFEAEFVGRLMTQKYGINK